MHSACLALFWHQHQPYYSDDLTGETLMPWVRLHGTKDYIGMAMHLDEVPELHCTINLVPSLLVQILAYTEGRSDRHLDVSRRPADDLSRDDVVYLLDHFFMANVDNMIRPFPRYRELYLKRAAGKDTAEQAAKRFTARDLRDLQVWNNLTWFHPLLFEKDAELAAFLKRGQDYTEADKAWLLDRQKQILGEIIPLHRKLYERGQLEITTTPFYHPILPLLWDKRSAKETMPHTPLPKYLDPYPEDARVHVQRAVSFHKKLFGKPPRGMWPSEGSVSQAIIPLLAESGIQWIATDEEILSESTGGWVSRDGQGHVRNPEMLFRPWRVEEGPHQLQMVFRDHALSDLVGFHYQRSDPQHAAFDLLGKVDAIGRAASPHNGGRPPIVPVILDGENCWEYYPDGGVSFLRTLYREAVKHQHVRSVKIGEYVDQYPATDKISRLTAGSWISHNFAIWIGHQEDRDAWDLLHQTREFLVQKQAEGKAPADRLQQAWEEIYIAEGSDWFWWYGDDHNSELDAVFDHLFRRHLSNVYTLLGVSAPPILSKPVTRTAQRQLHTQPTGFLPVRVDGKETFFEWINAGKYVAGSQRGTMTLVTQGLVQQMLFGFDPQNLLIRIDAAGRANDKFASVDEIRIRFIEPMGIEIVVTGLTADQKTIFHLHSGGTVVELLAARIACGEILELSVGREQLGLAPHETLHFFIELLHGSQSLDRIPIEGAIQTSVPPPDFEQVMWQA